MTEECFTAYEYVKDETIAIAIFAIVSVKQIH